MNKNNYRLYNDPETGKFVFLPHGMDQMFGNPETPIFPAANGLMARAILETPEGRKRYREKFEMLFSNVFRAEVLTNRVQELHQRLQTELVPFSKEAASNRTAASANLQNQIVRRGDALKSMLAAEGAP